MNRRRPGVRSTSLARVAIEQRSGRCAMGVVSDAGVYCVTHKIELMHFVDGVD